jgi:hypothetical protein
MDIVSLEEGKRDAKQRYLSSRVRQIHYFGHSFIANDYTPTNGLAGALYADRCIGKVTEILSGGTLPTGVIVGHGGYQTVQMLNGGGKAGSPATLPTLLAAIKPGDFVVCDVDDNDNGSTDAVTGDTYAGITLAQSISNETSIYRQIIQAGGVPILTGKFPSHQSKSSGAAWLQDRAWWRSDFARVNGLPYIVWGAPFEDPSSTDWIGYNAAGGTWNYDDIHPNGPAVAVLAQQIIAVVNSYRPPVQRPGLPQGNINSHALIDLASTNACFLTDTNADGVADKITVSGSPTGTLVAMTTSEGAGVGQTMNWQQLAFAGAGSAQLGSLFALTAGHRLRVVLNLKTTGVQSTASSFDVVLQTSDAATNLGGIRLFKNDIAQISGQPAPALIIDATVPAGLSLGSGRVMLTPRGPGACTFSIGRFSAYDMTAQAVVASAF